MTHNTYPHLIALTGHAGTGKDTVRAMLEQVQDLLYRVTRWKGENHEVLTDLHDIKEAVKAVLAAPATAPAWHDAPTVPGLWFCDEGDICYTWTAHNIEILDIEPEDEVRWYGPIPLKDAK